jgi:hypothetical protein
MGMYRDFLLMLQPISGDPKAIWYQSDEPVEWTEARDRIVASGATQGYRIGGYGAGQYMISVDPREIALHRRAKREPVRLPAPHPSHDDCAVCQHALPPLPPKA